MAGKVVVSDFEADDAAHIIIGRAASMNETDPGLFEVLSTTRAIRRLKSDPVPEELLRQLIQAAQWAPSGSNQQSSRWIIVRDSARKQRLAELNRAAVEGYIAVGRAALADVPEVEAKSRHRLLDSLQWQAEHLQDTPALVIACMALTRTPPDRFVNGLGYGGSIWPGVQNVLLAARGLGLGAALTTLALSDRDAFKAALDIPEGIEPVCLIPVGYPIDRFGPVSRRPLDDVLRWDHWS